MLALTIGQALMAFVFCLVCVLLILLILIQKGRGGGLSGAFGGVGSYSPFGTKTGDALTWATVILTGLFLLIAVLANYIYKPQKLTGLGATPAATAPLPAGEGEMPGAPAEAGSPIAPLPTGPGATTPPAPVPVPPAAPVGPVTPGSPTPITVPPAAGPEAPRPAAPAGE